MANNVFGNLGSIFGGIATEFAKSDLAPKDDLNIMILNAQAELSELSEKETGLYAEIGREAYQTDPEAFAQHITLSEIQAQISALNEKIRDLENKIKAEKEAAEKAAGGVCPNCGSEYKQGVKFCQECGTNVSQIKTEPEGKFCTECGTKNEAGTNFCRECGTKL